VDELTQWSLKIAQGSTRNDIQMRSKDGYTHGGNQNRDKPPLLGAVEAYSVVGLKEVFHFSPSIMIRIAESG
jgi:hypothetical protein